MSQREMSPRLAATSTASQASASVSVPLLKTSERSNGASVLAAGCKQGAKRFAAFCFPSCDSSRKQRRVSSCLSPPGLSQWRRFSSPASVCFGAPAVQNSLTLSGEASSHGAFLLIFHNAILEICARELCTDSTLFLLQD